MELVPQTQDTQEMQDIRESRLTAYKSLAYKYGIAMVVLVLNNFVVPYLFSLLIFIPAGLLGISIEEGSDVFYTLVMLLNELSAYAVPVLVLRAMFSRERGEFVPDRTYSRIPCESVLLFLAGVAAGSVGSIITTIIDSVISSVFGTEKIKDAFSGMEPQNPYQFAVFALCICIVAPVCEEYIFRDLLLKPLRCFHDGAAVIFTGLVFGLYHGNFDQFAYAAMLGIFYSIIAVRANSIAPSVLLHLANNLLVCLSTYTESAFGHSELQDIVSMLLSLMLPAGIIAMIFAAAGRCFLLHSHDRFLTNSEIAKKLAFSPAVIIGTVIMLAAFFL